LTWESSCPGLGRKSKTEDGSQGDGWTGAKGTEMDSKELEILKTRVRNERDTREEIIRAVNGRADRLTLAVMQLESRTALYRVQCEVVKEMHIQQEADNVSDEDWDNATALAYEDSEGLKEAFDEVLAAQVECCPPVNHEALLRVAKDELRHAQDSGRENEVALLEKAALYHQRMLAAR